MKLKSILIMTMVAIMAIAGGAMAATTNTTTSTNTDAGGHLFFHVPGQLGAACVPITNAASVDGGTNTNTCAAMTAAQATALATDSQTGSGTGFGAAAMPAQVAYAANQYTAGVGPNSGYALNANLFGMCAGTGNATGVIVQTCPFFVPAAGSVGANAIGVAAAQALMDGTNLGVGLFNEATFATGLVSGFQTGTGATTFNNTLSQATSHHALVTGGTGTNTDGDYIDQRLAQVIGTNQTLTQSTTIGGSSGSSVAVTVDTNAQSATWLLNVDPFGGANVQNGGQIQQGVGDNFSGGFGDYGQIFANTDVTVVNNIVPAPVNGAFTSYAATGAQFGATPAGALTLP